MIADSKCKVFFYTYPEDKRPDFSAFQDLIVNLADGFNSIGIQHYSSCNYWRLFPEREQYLLQVNPDISHHDCDVVVLERQWFARNRSLPKGLFDPCRKYITVYLDCADGIKTFSWLPEFRKFDFILKTHYIKGFKYPHNVCPWAFGLSTRVLSELKECKPLLSRNKKLLVNFEYHNSVKYYHSLRKYIGKFFMPNIQNLLPIDSTREDRSVPPNNSYHYLRWLQTGRRHIPSYYERLGKSQACAAFGGTFLAPQITDFNSRVSYYSARVLDKLGIKTNRIIQWDSWRFWESLAAGCVTFHVDFEKYGFILPELPRNWEHYVGIDLDNIQESVKRIREQPEILERISTQGRAWVIQNYSPKAVAKRFINTVLEAS